MLFITEHLPITKGNMSYRIVRQTDKKYNQAAMTIKSQAEKVNRRIPRCNVWKRRLDMDEIDIRIPNSQKLLEVSKKYDIILISASDLENGFDIEVYCDLERFFMAAKAQGATVLYCDYQYYESKLFLIDEEQYDIGNYSLKAQQTIKEKVKNYNADLNKKYDFTRPCSLYIRALLPNGKAIQLSFIDNWLEKDNGENDEWLIPFAEDAFENVILDNIHDRSNYLHKKMAEKNERIIEADKIVFDYLLSSPQYNLCTTKESRKQFAYDIISQDQLLKNRLDELGIERGYGYFLFIVEVVWKLKKQGKTEFDDVVASVMHYPLREIKRKF